jgi:hypothetical protein
VAVLAGGASPAGALRDRIHPFQALLRRGALSQHRHVHVDVPARRLGSPWIQHALPLDLRRQHRGSSGAWKVPALLPSLRHRSRAGSCFRQSHLADSGGRCLRSNRRGTRRVHHVVSECTGHDLHPDRVLHRHAGASRIAGARVVVRNAALQWSGFSRSGNGAGYGRRRVVRSHRRVCGRPDSSLCLRRKAAADSLSRF